MGVRKDVKEDLTFIFWLTRDMHQQIKIRATLRNVSMGRWIKQAVMERIKREEKYESKLKE